MHRRKGLRPAPCRPAEPASPGDFPAWRPGGWRLPIRLEGEERFRRALAGGKGAILWVAHFSSNALATKMALDRAGFRVWHISRPEHGFSKSRFGIRWLNPIRIRAERRHLAGRLEFDRAHPAKAMVAARRALRSGEIVSITAGAWEGRSLASAKLFGGSPRLAVGAPRLSLLTGAPAPPGLHGPRRRRRRHPGPARRTACRAGRDAARLPPRLDASLRRRNDSAHQPSIPTSGAIGRAFALPDVHQSSRLAAGTPNASRRTPAQPARRRRRKAAADSLPEQRLLADAWRGGGADRAISPGRSAIRGHAAAIVANHSSANQAPAADVDGLLVRRFRFNETLAAQDGAVIAALRARYGSLLPAIPARLGSHQLSRRGRLLSPAIDRARVKGRWRSSIARSGRASSRSRGGSPRAPTPWSPHRGFWRTASQPHSSIPAREVSRHRERRRRGAASRRPAASRIADRRASCSPGGCVHEGYRCRRRRLEVLVARGVAAELSIAGSGDLARTPLGFPHKPRLDRSHRPSRRAAAGEMVERFGDGGGARGPLAFLRSLLAGVGGGGVCRTSRPGVAPGGARRNRRRRRNRALFEPDDPAVARRRMHRVLVEPGLAARLGAAAPRPSGVPISPFTDGRPL